MSSSRSSRLTTRSRWTPRLLSPVAVVRRPTRPPAVHRPCGLGSACARLDVARRASLASGIGTRSGSQAALRGVSPLAASASCIDAMATSIIESSGCLVVMRLEPDARQEQPADGPVLAVLGAPAEDLVGDRGDDRDEQDAADDARRAGSGRRAG